MASFCFVQRSRSTSLSTLRSTGCAVLKATVGCKATADLPVSTLQSEVSSFNGQGASTYTRSTLRAVIPRIAHHQALAVHAGKPALGLNALSGLWRQHIRAHLSVNGVRRVLTRRSSRNLVTELASPTMRGVPPAAPLEPLPSTTNPAPRPIGDGVRNSLPCGAAEGTLTTAASTSVVS